MGKLILNFASRNEPDDIFKLVKSREKTIETRPATKKIRNLKPGDELVLVSNDTGEEISRKVGEIRIYKTLEEMSENEDASKILPGVQGWDELLNIYEEVKKKWGSNYAKNIKENGIAAIEIE